VKKITFFPLDVQYSCVIGTIGGTNMKSKKSYFNQMKKRPVQAVRYVVQLSFVVFLLFVAVRLYQFYFHFASYGLTPLVEKPPAVEGFLPLSALMGFKVWFLTGEFDQIHPAGLVLFTFFVGSGLLFRKAFCSWICPIGTVSEWASKLGNKILGKNYDLPWWVIWMFYPMKFLILAFILKIILIDMPLDEVITFLSGSYNKVSDMKLMLFFMNISGAALFFIFVLFVLSMIFKNFWCRLMCPYGALIGLGSLIGITKIKRNEDTCISCEMCTKVCPQGIKVSEMKAVKAPECSSCMHCVEACPVKDTLNMTVAGKKTNKWLIPIAFFVLFFIVISYAKATGHWETTVINKEFKELILNIDSFDH
jgi:polyferredoxin